MLDKVIQREAAILGEKDTKKESCNKCYKNEKERAKTKTAIQKKKS